MNFAFERWNRSEAIDCLGVGRPRVRRCSRRVEDADVYSLIPMHPSRRLVRRGFLACLAAVALFSLYSIYSALAELDSQNDSHGAEALHVSKEKDFSKDECMPKSSELSAFPACFEKIEWLEKGWKTHACYVANGVDGSMCSFRRYLSEVERHCPPFGNHHQNTSTIRNSVAKANSNIDELFAKFSDSPQNYFFIKGRIGRLWSQWLDALEQNTRVHPDFFGNRVKLTIMVHMGFLARASGTRFGDFSSKGGPLGELVQWSDLLAGLHSLGHRLVVSTETSTLYRNIDAFSQSAPCPSLSDGSPPHIDLIFTDIMGLRHLRKRKAFLDANKCKFRLLDSFGTQAQFNLKAYFTKHTTALGSKKNPWGGHAFNLRQFWTMYPHTHDNTFLGFVVEAAEKSELSNEKRSGVLVYGKEKYMWEKSEDVIKTLLSLTEVHATVADADSPDALPKGVVNHGLLDEAGFHRMLSSVSAFVGLGFPFEGPAPLEAIAHGAVFINPRFDPPKGRLSDPFFAEKPTLRALTSQCPYLEGIGEPWVITVNTRDSAALKRAVRTALNATITPFVPEELTARGMLLRVAVLAARLDTCSGVAAAVEDAAPAWPPRQALRVQVSAPGASCETACEGDKTQPLRCEPAFFPLVNTPKAVMEHLGCSDASRAPSILAPSRCALQQEALLFSCSASLEGAVRLCPCRDFIPDQHALCTDCIR